MKKLFLITLLSSGFNSLFAQTEASVFSKQSTGAIPSLNAAFLNASGNADPLVAFDSSRSDYHLYHWRASGTEPALSIRYFIGQVGADADMGKPGMRGIKGVELQGPFLKLFPIYKQFADARADLETIKNAGTIGAKKEMETNMRIRFYRTDDARGIWLLKFNG